MRLIAAAKKYTDVFKSTGVSPLIITLSGGTPHKPNPVGNLAEIPVNLCNSADKETTFADAAGFTVFEATAAARWLYDNSRKYHINPADIMEELFSLDTIGNVSSICGSNWLAMFN
jgi:hypothetical protein